MQVIDRELQHVRAALTSRIEEEEEPRRRVRQNLLEEARRLEGEDAVARNASPVDC